MEEDEASDPVGVGVLGADAVAGHAAGVADAVEQTRWGGRGCEEGWA